MADEVPKRDADWTDWSLESEQKISVDRPQQIESFCLFSFFPPKW